MNNKLTRIVAAIIDRTHLKLYKENGDEITIPQGDPRVKTILDSVTESLINHGWVDVDLSQDNHYLEFQELTNGNIKLYRISRDKLKHLMAMGIAEEHTDVPIEPVNIGTLPLLKDPRITKTNQCISEILEHATKVSDDSFTEDGLIQQGDIVESSGTTIQRPTTTSTPDTMIAVVNDKIIPNMELIKNQFMNANIIGSSKGIEAFLYRISAVIDERSHSIEDLLKFLERADLPIADDGTILIYKVLQRVNEGDKHTFVDCHTRNVKQWVGAYVCMEHSLVDPNRANECSNGLHVARRGYIREFSGDVCVLAKLAPEDVIAVPEYDANKMRVCGYHIIEELPANLFKLLKENKPISDDKDGAALLAQALNGNHIGITHEIKIHGHKGTNVVVTDLGTLGASETKEPVASKTKPTKVNVSTLDSIKGKTTAEHVKPKDVLTKREKLVRDAAKATELFDEDELEEFAYQERIKDTEKGSNRERIKKLISLGLNVDIARRITLIKKQAKKSWEVLGVNKKTSKKILKLSGV